MANTAANTANGWAVRLYDRLTRLVSRGGWATRYASAVLSPVLVSFLLGSSHLGLDQTTLSLTYLLGVFFVASIAGLGPGVAASLLSFMLYNAFFVAPYYRLTVAHPQDLVRLLVFLVAALLASTLAGLALERAQLMRQLADQAAQADADGFKATLLASVSHDLRTPLATITGVASALRAGDIAWNSPERAELLDSLVDEAERLNRLVGNLLVMSRVEGGALDETRAWEEIGDITGAVLARLRPLLDERLVRVALPCDLPLVWVNAALLDQVLTNLFENALKYTPNDAMLTIAAATQGDELRVTVADTGPGVAVEALPYVFDKFFRVSGLGRATQGTGLGLAICKGIIEAHGGRIWAENRPEGGLAITFTLPLQPLAAPPLPVVSSEMAFDGRRDELYLRRQG